MKMSELIKLLSSNLEEYKEKNVVIAKNLLKSDNRNFTFIPVDFKVFYDSRNDTVILVEEKDSYFFD